MYAIIFRSIYQADLTVLPSGDGTFIAIICYYCASYFAAATVLQRMSANTNQRDDLPILCERFTTSKLKNFEDLTSIGTYGFRGEALASISHIAHLSVTTKTADSSCAWKAHYAGGHLVPSKPGQSPDPKPCAGRPGTQITVEDLFYNIPTRRRAFRSTSEEYAKILDLVGRYAVHCSNVAFSCKKHGDSAMGISVISNATTHDRIRQVYGNGVASELLNFEVANDRWGFKSKGWISSLNHSSKRTVFLLFINHRSVESSAIRKAIEQTYSAFLSKGSHPFVYLSLEIDPARVDVNVHPTKREVNFLNEDEIIEVVCEEMRSTLGKVDTSRTFITQSLLPGASKPGIQSSAENEASKASVPSHKLSVQKKSTATPVPQKQYDNNLIRTDSKVRKITTMLPLANASTPSKVGTDLISDGMNYEYMDKEQTLCRLMSIKELRADVRKNMHNELTNIFASHTFVGVVDEQRRIVAIQGGVKLFLVDYGMVCHEYFYQVGLTEFGNFGCIKINPALRLHDVLTIAASQEKNAKNLEDDLNWDEVVRMVELQLISRREMLAEYFSLDISEEGELHGIPLLMKGYMPSLAKLPQFLLRLGPHVDWVDEKGCFHTFLRELAGFYVPEALPLQPHTTPVDEENDQEPEEDEELILRREQLNRMLEHVIFPALKARLVATTGLLRGVTEIADLKGLYRVFERC